MRPDVQRAAKRLVDALERVESIEGLRAGLAANITFTEVNSEPTNPSHREALDALPVWQALEGLVVAVQAHKE